jgi:hypothetical protein
MFTLQFSLYFTNSPVICPTIHILLQFKTSSCYPLYTSVMLQPIGTPKAWQKWMYLIEVIKWEFQICWKACFFFFGLLTHLFICAYIVWAIFPPCPLPSPSSPHCQAEPVLPSYSILLKRRHNQQERHSVFASWDKGSYIERFLALLPCTSVLQPELILHDLFTTSQSPSHSDLCRFKVTISLLYSGDIKHFQVLGFLPFPIPPVCALLLACDPSPIILLHLF